MALSLVPPLEDITEDLEAELDDVLAAMAEIADLVEGPITLPYAQIIAKISKIIDDWYESSE